MCQGICLTLLCGVISVIGVMWVSATILHNAEPNPRIVQVVKLGGAAVTDRSQYRTAKLHAINLTATQLHDSMRDVHEGTVLVHDEGSFGHPEAVQYGISKGTNALNDTTEYWQGFALAHEGYGELSALVVKQLLKAGVPAVVVHSLGLFETSAGVMTDHAQAQLIETIRYFLARGAMPVAHGDVTYDTAQGGAVVSGDVVMDVLATRLRPERAVFLTDVAGVYDLPPERVGSKLLTCLTVDASTGEVTGKLPEADAAAGSILNGKIKDSVSIAVSGVDVWITKAGSDAAASLLRGGEPAEATLVTTNGTKCKARMRR